MTLEVVISKNELAQGRKFENFNEAFYYMSYNEYKAKIYLNNKHGEIIENMPKYSNELRRNVYQNDLGEKRYYILKIV